MIPYPCPPVVTILCLSYNHERFLRQCLDGFVMQKVNFPVEVIIHDDASTDNSQAIIKEYIHKYPEFQWVPILQTENQYSQGNSVVALSVKYARGKYFAPCEGDDYWTDPYKLQKQVDFLEANPDVSICHHAARMTWEGGEHADEIYPRDLVEQSQVESTAEQIARGRWLVTSSVVFRWCFNRSDFKFEEHFPTNIFSGDTMLFLMHAMRGRCMQIPGIMSVYRRHAGGVTHQRDNREDAFYVKHGLRMINNFVQMQNITGLNFDYERVEMIKNCMFACFVLCDTDILQQIKELYPNEYKQVAKEYRIKYRHDSERQWQQLLRTTPTLKFLKSKLLHLFSRCVRTHNAS